MGFLTGQPIRLEPLVDAVAAPARGGIVTFLGLVRDRHEGRVVTGLEYSAYQPMAESVCRDLLAETEAKWPVRATLAHRVGQLGIGDVAVAIAVAGEHRDEAFAACRFLIEELKRRVPIWKRESYADGTESWVDPTSASPSAVREEARPW